MPSLPRETRLVVFAKAPVPGQAKTRLAPALGADGAAALAERLLEHAVAVAVAARLGPVELCTAGDAAHPAFERLHRQHRLLPGRQADGDLGQRMQQALHLALAGGTPALLIGTDAPALDATLLRRAAAALEDADAVFVPAFDGGYVLVGLRRPAAALFEGIAWSSAAVMQQTRQRVAAAGLRGAELPALADIDEPGDLQHLPAGAAAFDPYRRSP